MYDNLEFIYKYLIIAKLFDFRWSMAGVSKVSTSRISCCATMIWATLSLFSGSYQALFYFYSLTLFIVFDKFESFG